MLVSTFLLFRNGLSVSCLCSCIHFLFVGGWCVTCVYTFLYCLSPIPPIVHTPVGKSVTVFGAFSCCLLAGSMAPNSAQLQSHARGGTGRAALRGPLVAGLRVACLRCLHLLLCVIFISCLFESTSSYSLSVPLVYIGVNSLTDCCIYVCWWLGGPIWTTLPPCGSLEAPVWTEPLGMW